LVLSPLAAAEAVIGPKQKELGSALINIGASTTSLAVFEEGELLHTAVIPIGSEHITADVAIGLRCPIDLADRIKLEYGSAMAKKFNKKEEIDISELLNEDEKDNEAKTISRKYLAEIIGARVEEIFEKVDEELKKIDRSGMLPGGVFLIGGGTRLADIIEIAKKQLRLPAALGMNYYMPAIIDKVNETEYLNALGLVVWGSQVSAQEGGFGKLPGSAVMDRAFKKLKGLLTNFIPK
ncbi:MAG: cell division FtsA domain-containing protein, partial [Patescibacteria group bacterium]|nr:cell division FtsA domain-containing protein [Patescibacteria group bacterium]